MEDAYYRLITRSDFDGLVCAILLRELDLIDRIQFVHPKDMQDGLIPVTPADITANLPYNANAALIFDHHISEAVRIRNKPENYILDPNAPSTARVIYEYYGGREKFSHVDFYDMLAAVDKCDSASFTEEDILHPSGWVLLSFLVDSRTGLGRFKNFRISNYDLMLELIDLCRDLQLDEVLQSSDVAERVDLYFSHQEPSTEQLRRCTDVVKNVGIMDLRNEDPIYAHNRFLVYALFPEINISVNVLRGHHDGRVVFAVGKSILNRTSLTKVGAQMLRFGGGGHDGAGTCQADLSEAEEILKVLVDQLTQDG